MDTLCSVCQSIVYDRGRNPVLSSGSLQHHQTLQAVQAAAANGCRLCDMLWRSLTAEELDCMLGAKQDGQRTTESLIKWHGTRITGSNFLSPGRFKLHTTTKTFEKALCFQTREDSNVPETDLLKYQSVSTGSAETLHQAAQWVSNCVLQHRRCANAIKMQRKLPTRLLKVGALREKSVRLCNTVSLPQETLYMTLSHCWGQNTILILTKDKITTYESQISVDTMPKTFRDAIEITRVLGIHYIWIDSLCIVQDSKEDWQRESLLMGSVYSHSYCNIAATKSPDSQGGCFSEQAFAPIPVIRDCTDVMPLGQIKNLHLPTDVMPLGQITNLHLPRDTTTSHGAQSARKCGEDHFQTRPQNAEQDEGASISRDDDSGSDLERSENEIWEFGHPSGPYWVHLQHIWEEEVRDSVLLSRAWVFQERLLAPRVLHFAKSQVFFECHQTCAGQLFHGTTGKNPYLGIDLPVIDSSKHWLDQSDPGTMVNLGSALLNWERLTSAYNICALTNESDRFIAIAGLARKLRPFFNGRYLAGLWESGLVDQLTWIGSSAYSEDRGPTDFDFLPSRRLQSEQESSINSRRKLPTWSWTCKRGQINTPSWFAPMDNNTTGWFSPVDSLSSNSYGTPDMSIEDVDVLTIDGDEMSEVLSGNLRVTAKLIPAVRSHGFINVNSWNTAGIEIRNVRFPFWPDVPTEELDGPLFSTICTSRLNRMRGNSVIRERPRETWCVRGLVLKSTGRKRGQFYRVGCYVSLFESDLDKTIHRKANRKERRLITSDLYEVYYKESDKYRFTII